jgi:hypothetical protein
VIDRRRLAAEYGIGEGMALTNGNWRQINPVRHIADGVDVLRACARIFIDRDATVFCDFDADFLKT